MFTLNCKGRSLVIDTPLVMGIINATPDSFYTGSRVTSDSAVEKAEQMLREGAGILDIGGQSSRPGSDKISMEEELKRVIPVIKAIQDHFPETFISIDTYYAKVAAEAVAAGASIVNDISAGRMDEKMVSTVASLHVPYICMHMKGDPQNMQKAPVYENVTKEVLDFFIHRLEEIQQAGIADTIIDPGLGFGKTIHHNFQLLRELQAFNILQKPLLIGVSRKSTIYRTLEITPEEALNGTTVLHTIGLLHGANILRVHDVKEAVEAVKLFNAYVK